MQLSRNTKKSKEDAKRRRATTLFPKRSLFECLKIAESIRDNNNLQPYNKLTLASSLAMSPNSSSFRMLITHSATYGLTSGSYAAENISLTSLGLSIVSPKSGTEKNEALKKALFNIPLFSKFFSKFNQGAVPKKDLLKNTLHRDYNIPMEDSDACYDIIIKNAKELGILNNIKGNDYIQLDKLSSLEMNVPQEEVEFTKEDSQYVVAEEEKRENKDQLLKSSITEKPKVFISHSKNKKIVEQIKKLLDFGQFEYVIAEERETTAIPIAEKVFGLVKDCNCAIINLSVDQQEQSNGEYYINQNVLIEIGAALGQYNKKVILLVDKRFLGKTPSNLDGLYRCEYEGNELSFDTAMKLQQALTEFRKK